MALIGTSDVRTWLQLAEGDNTPNAKIASLITAVQKFADNYVGYPIEANTYTSNPEYCILDGTGSYVIYLPISPISSISDVRVDADRVFGDGTELDVTNDIFFYKNGKVISEGGYFTRGHRNVRVDYVAGYAPVTGGTHNAAVSSYPIGDDMKQTMLEMVTKSFKEGATLIHTAENEAAGQTIQQMLATNSFWRKTLNVYKDYSQGLMGYVD